MKKPKFKISQELMFKISQSAKELPPMVKTNAQNQPITTEVVVSGRDITPADLKPGQPYDRNLNYRIRRLVYENHQDNMVQLARDRGEQGVDDYITAVKAQFAAAVKETKERNSWWNRAKEYFTKLIQKNHE